MTRVLHIIWNARFGGIERLVHDLAEEQNRGATIVAEVLISKPQGEFLEAFKKGNFRCHFLNFKNGVSFSLGGVKKALTLFRSFDVLHLHFYNPVIAALAIFSKKQIVYTEHGNFGFGRKRKWSDTILEMLKRKFLNRRSVQVVYNSEFTKNYFLKEGFQPKFHQNHKVVLNGINLQTDTSPGDDEVEAQKFNETKKLLEGKFVIGTSSRFAGFKRIDRLIDAFAELQKHEKFCLLLVGDGVLRPQLEVHVERLNIKNRVIFTGFVENVRAYQNLMDVCVFPSESEPFGLAAVEALSLGKPTLAFKDGGGLVEIVRGICPEDVIATKEALNQRIEYYFYLGKNADSDKKRIAYSAEFSITRMAEELNGIYLKS